MVVALRRVNSLASWSDNELLHILSTTIQGSKQAMYYDVQRPLQRTCQWVESEHNLYVMTAQSFSVTLSVRLLLRNMVS